MTDHAALAYCFPGVGVRLTGAEAPFFERHLSILEPLIERAGRYAGADLVGPLFRSEIASLTDHAQQCFTYAFSVGVAEVLRRQGIRPATLAGYSFGVYAALQASGAVAFDAGLQILDRAYALMARCLPDRACGMGTIVGLTRSEVDRLLADERCFGLRLTVVNSDTCHVVSGFRDQLEVLLAEALACDAITAELLPVAIPYHHGPLLGAAVDPFGDFLQTLSIADPDCPVVSTIDQSLLTSAGALIDFAARNLATPISWPAAVAALHRARIRTIAECGPGISLTQNGRFLPYGDITYFNVKKLALGLVP